MLSGRELPLQANVMRAGRSSQAVRYLRLAMTKQEQLARLDPGRPEYHTWLAVFRVAEGESLMRLDGPPGSRTSAGSMPVTESS